MITTKDLHRRKRYTRPKNLKDHLVRARTIFKEETTPPSLENKTKDKSTPNECKKTNCKYCKILNKQGEIKSKTMEMNHTTKHNTTCNSSNVIYCIECKTCNTQYVGQTKRKIKERIREHLLTIKKNHGRNDVTTHFNLCDHHGIEDVQVYILVFIYRHPDSLMAGRLRNTIGFNWIHRLKTQSPQGLNTIDNRYG